MSPGQGVGAEARHEEEATWQNLSGAEHAR